jgi:hypothetical protein
MYCKTENNYYGDYMKKSKKKHKKKSCGSKSGHKTIDGAYGEIRALNKKNFIFHKLQPYKCNYCGMWHVGRSKLIHYDMFDKLKK